jgi:hypothetical protein
MNSADMATALINRAKSLQQFIIVTDVPDDFRFNGLIPFDMEIKEGVINAKVYGVDFDEAVNTFHAYLETCK